MMTKSVILLFFICLLVIGCVSQNQETVPSINQTPQPSLTSRPIDNSSGPVPPTTPQIQAHFTNKDVNEHFLSIAFGRTNTRLKKFTTGSAHKVTFDVKGKSTSDDVKFMNDFAEVYNEITQTETFHNPARTGTDNVWSIPINFYPSDYLEALPEKSIQYKKTDPDTGEYLYLISYPKLPPYDYVPPQYYVNSDLSGDERNHYIMNAMLHFLGFSGETYNYPDSFFYADNPYGIILSPIDKAAINVMYNPLLYEGMSIEGVEDALFIGN